MELTQAQAYGLLTLYCVIYVLPLHASSSTRPTVNRSRDDPSTIRARIRAVTLSTILCSLSTLLLLNASSHESLSPWALMGYWPVGLVPTSKALLLTMLLFAAPLYEALWLDGVWQDWARLQPLKELWKEWPQWRNYVAGPITEECLFRSASVPLLLVAGTPITQIILLSPVVFGLAHIHHFYEFRIANPNVALPMAIARTVLQFSYTSLFGMYGTFLFLRTGSLLAVIAVHAFCNSMGLPRIWGRVEPWWMSPQEIDGPAGTRWTIVYYILLFGGMTAWYQGFWPLTQNTLALTTF